MYAFRFWAPVALFSVLGLAMQASAYAAVTTTGDVDPIPPSAGGSPGGTQRIGEGNTQGDILYGSMTIDGGTVLENTSGIIGDRLGAIGTVLVDGAGSEWNLSSELTVGNDGLAELNLSNMARIFVGNDMYVGRQDDGHGTTTIDGLVTNLEVADDFTVGYDGFAEFLVSDRARLITGDAWIGRRAGSIGRITLQDPGSMWLHTRDVVVASVGIGTLQIQNGAFLDNRAAIIGELANGLGSAIVSGLHSRWHGSTTLTVGSAGEGALHISEQARVEFSGAVIGAATTGIGNVIVEDEGTVWHTGNSLVVGDNGLGAIEVRNRGLVNVLGTTEVGALGRIALEEGRLASPSIVNAGVMQGTGQIIGEIVNRPTGEVRAGHDEYLHATGAVSNSGRLEAIGGEMEFDALVTNEETDGQIAAGGAIFRFRGGLENDGTLAATFGTSDVFGDIDNNASGAIVVAGDAGVTFYDKVTNDGSLVVLPGATAVFARDLTFTSGGSLHAGLGGRAAGSEYAQIEVGGEAALAGRLEISLESAFSPVAGDAFELIAAGGGVSGVFGTADLPILSDGLAWDVDYSSHRVTLRVLAMTFLPSDFDQNGSVDGNDFLLWQSGFGIASGATKMDGDADGDGDVDGDDFLAWQSEFGSVSGSVNAAVPEPAAVLLLVVGGMGLLLRLPR